MTEKELQYKIVSWFSHNYIKHRGLLFLVDNDTHNINHAQTKRALGMISGVSDLILINPFNGQINGIELKAPGSRHEVKKLQNQLSWGKQLIRMNCNYIMSSREDLIKQFISEIVNTGAGFNCMPVLDESKKTHFFHK